MDDEALARLLHQARRVDPQRLQQALAAARGRPGGLAGLLVEQGLVSRAELEQVFLPRLATTTDGPTASGSIGRAVDETRAGPAAARGERRIGRYVVVRELGRGGMGVVLEAVDPTLGRRVALKQSLEAGPGLERMKREAALVSRLTHPSIAVVHELAHDERGLPYFAMQLVEGRPLSSIVKAEGPLEPARALRLVTELADAVAHAHERGVVHRDLKPSNVIVTPSGLPVVLDFGLARSMGQEGGLTKTGEALGTPAYMAPEQVDVAKEAGPPADVYGLGATLWELLVGRPPFEGGMMQIISRKLTAEPPRAGSLRAGVPAALDEVCARCLRIDPAARYPDAGALRDALRAAAAAPPPASRAPWIVAGAVVSLGLAGGLVAAALRPRPAEAPVEVEPRAQVAALLSAVGAGERSHEDALAAALALPADEARAALVDELERTSAALAAAERASLVAAASDGAAAGAGHDELLAALRGDAGAPGELSLAARDALDARRAGRAALDDAQGPVAAARGRLACEALAALPGDAGRAPATLARHAALEPSSARAAHAVAALERLAARGAPAPPGVALALALERHGADESLAGRLRALGAAPLGPPPWSYGRALQAAGRGGLRLRRALGDPAGKLAGDPGVLVVSPDGRRALVGLRPWWGDMPGLLHLVELPSLREVVAARGHDGGVVDALFTADGRRAVTAGREGVRLWRTEAGLDGPLDRAAFDGVVALRPLPGRDRALVAFGSSVAVLTIGDAGLTAARPIGLGAPVAVALPLDASRAFVVAGERAYVLGLEDGKRAALPGDHARGLRAGSPGAGALCAAAASPDGRRVVVVGPENALRLWELAPPAFHTLRPSTGGAHAVAWSARGDRLLATTDGEAAPFDLATRREGPAHRLVGGIAPSAALLGERLLYGVRSHLELLDLETGRALLPPAADPVQRVRSLAVSADGGRLLVGCAEGYEDATAHVFDLREGTRTRTIATGLEVVQGVGLGRDGARGLLLGSRGRGPVQVWDLAGGTRELATQPSWGSTALAAGALSPSAEQAITTSQDGHVTLWDLASGGFRELAGHGNGSSVVAAVYAPDGRSAVTVSRAGRTRPPALRRWDLGSGDTTVTLLVGDPRALAWLPGSTDVLLGGDGGVERRDERGEPGRRYATQPIYDGPYAVAATATRLAVAYHHGDVEVFDVATGRPIGTFDPGLGGDRATALAFTPAGALLVGTARGMILELQAD